MLKTNMIQIKTIEKDIEYAHVDSVKIFKFIQHLKENPSIIINGFTTVTDINVNIIYKSFNTFKGENRK